MTDETARRLANAIMGLAVAGGAYVVVSKPGLRRLAWKLALTALTVTLPTWLIHEVGDAWADSRQRVR